MMSTIGSSKSPSLHKSSQKLTEMSEPTFSKLLNKSHFCNQQGNIYWRKEKLNFSRNIVLFWLTKMPFPVLSSVTGLWNNSPHSWYGLQVPEGAIWTFPLRTAVFLPWPLWWFDLASPNSTFAVLKWRNGEWGRAEGQTESGRRQKNTKRANVFLAAANGQTNIVCQWGKQYIAQGWWISPALESVPLGLIPGEGEAGGGWWRWNKEEI